MENKKITNDVINNAKKLTQTIEMCLSNTGCYDCKFFSCEDCWEAMEKDSCETIKTLIQIIEAKE